MQYLGSAIAVAIAGLIASAVSQLFPLPHVTVLLLGAVLFSAVRWGLGPSLFAALLSVGVSSFFFMEPIYSFEVHRPQDIVDLIIFIAVSVMTSGLAARVRAQAKEAEAREARLRHLHTFSRSLAGVLDFDRLLQTIVVYYSALLRRRALLLLPEASGFRVISIPHETVQLTEADLREAARCWKEGRSSTTGESGSWLFRVLSRPAGPVGLLVLERGIGQLALPPDVEQAMELLLDQAATVIERARPVDSTAAARSG